MPAQNVPNNPERSPGFQQALLHGAPEVALFRMFRNQTKGSSSRLSASATGNARASSDPTLLPPDRQVSAAPPRAGSLGAGWRTGRLECSLPEAMVRVESLSWEYSVHS